MGKIDGMRGMAVRTGRAVLVALPLLVSATSAGAAEWVAVGEDGNGMAIFDRVGGQPAQIEELAARSIAPAPQPTWYGDDGNGNATFALPTELTQPRVGPVAIKPQPLYDNGEGLTYFAP